MMVAAAGGGPTWQVGLRIVGLRPVRVVGGANVQAMRCRAQSLLPDGSRR